MAFESEQNQFESFDRDSDEFLNLHKAVSSIFARHFVGALKGCSAGGEAHRFISTYEATMADFWLGEKAAATLTDLSLAVNHLSAAWEKLPLLVKHELAANSSFVDDENRTKYYDENTHRAVFMSGFPGNNACEAVRSLGNINNHRDVLLATISKTKKELPKGIQTRNRPIKEWSVIAAAAEIVRSHNAMNVPTRIDTSTPSGPFYELLAELFPLFKTTSSISGSIKGWSMHYDNKISDSDLMPI